MAETNTIYDNVSQSARINQEEERLFTVRPRYYANKGDAMARGEISTFRIVRSAEMSEAERVSFEKRMQDHERKAFNKLISEKGYYDFLLQGVQYSLQEKHQVFHTFGGKEAVYFYGQNPVEFHLNGLIIDDLDNDQFAQVLSLYQNHLRGTVASQNFSLVEISLPNVTIFGSILGITIAQQSDRDTDIGFQMTILAKHYIFRSTDEFYLNSEDKLNDYAESNLITTNPDQAKLEALFARYRETQVSADEMASLVGSSDKIVTAITQDYGYSIAAGGIYSTKVSTPGSLKDVLDSLESTYNLGRYINEGAEWLEEQGRYVTDVVGIINEVTGSVVQYLGQIETSLDNVLDTVGNVVGSVVGLAEDLEDAWGTVVNFPETIASKIGRFLEGGMMTTEGALLTGSSYVSSSDAEALLKTQARTNPGPVRGSRMDPSVSANQDDLAVLTF